MDCMKLKTQKMKELRRIAGISQRELALSIGVHRQSIARLETQDGLPRLPLLCKIARKLNCKLDDLVEF